MFAHTVLANALVANGMSKEAAKVEMEEIFALHGHFPRSKKLQQRLDALKEIAIWR